MVKVDYSVPEGQCGRFMGGLLQKDTPSHLEEPVFEFLVWSQHRHTGKCKRRVGGIYAYYRYFIDRKW